MHLQGLAAVITLLCLAAAPATRPIAKPTTPQELQAAYVAALNARDLDTLRSLYHADTPGRRKVVEAFIERDLVLNELAHLAAATYGTLLYGGGEDVSARPMEWRIDGGRAFAGNNENLSRVRLVREGETWKIYLWPIDGRGIDWADDPDKVANAAGNLRTAEYRSAIAHVKVGRFRSARSLAAAVTAPGDALKPVPGAGAMKPAQKPAIRPVKVDLSSPLKTYETLAHALIEGDGEAFLALVHAADEREKKLTAAVADFLKVSARFFVASAARFGPADAENLAEHAHLIMPDPHFQGLELLEDLDPEQFGNEFKVQGDAATIEGLSSGTGKLVRVDGSWKMRATADDADDAAEIDTLIKSFAVMSKLLNTWAAQVESGQLQTPEAVRAAIKRAVERAAEEP